MRLLSLATGAALIAGCGFANAQATNYSLTPGDAPTLSNSDSFDYRTMAQRRALERRGVMPGNWNDPAWMSYGYNSGWNSFGAGVQIGPVGVGIGDPWYGYGPRYAYRYRGW
jgi:hypothetical protein